jgi:hypothetical protein
MSNSKKKAGAASEALRRIDAAFMRVLVDAGFGLAQASDIEGGFVIESKTSYAERQHIAVADGGKRVDINALPAHKVKMPVNLGIRFRPAQSVITTPRFAPAKSPRVQPKNSLEVFDTLGEHRDFLQDRYNEAITRVREQRQEKIDARLEKNRELRDKQAEVADSWKFLQDPHNIGLKHTDVIDQTKKQSLDKNMRVHKMTYRQ